MEDLKFDVVLTSRKTCWANKYLSEAGCLLLHVLMIYI